MMEQLAVRLPQHYSALAKDNKLSEIGKQFAEFIKLQQTTSRKATPKRFSFELYVADDRCAILILNLSFGLVTEFKP